MIGFCGALDITQRSVEFSLLRRMSGLHSTGCAFINKEFGVLCDGGWGQSGECFQPVTVKYNNSLYTAAMIMDIAARGLETSTAEAILEGYFEEGEEYFRRLDFSYALALYDGRCGELLLCKGYKGDKPLFYTVKDGATYFASSYLPLFRLYGGCIRVNKKTLISYVLSEAPRGLPDGLFCDIISLPPGGSLLCSAFGQSLVKGESAGADSSSGEILTSPYTRKKDIRRILTDALFAFGYPQFDSLMPSAVSSIKNCSAKECCLPSLDAPMTYLSERAERLGRAWGVDVRYALDSDFRQAGRELRAIEREIEDIFDGLCEDGTSIVNRVFSPEFLEIVRNQKALPQRIRQMALVCQTQIWGESFNIVFC